jgi:hypothetical protein
MMNNLKYEISLISNINKLEAINKKQYKNKVYYTMQNHFNQSFQELLIIY